MGKSMKKNFRKGICLIFFFFTVVLIWGFSPLEEGEKLLMSNNPREALPFLEQALNTEPLNEKIYLYLGILYEQLAQPDKAISIMQRGLDVAKEHRDIFYYNIGNNFFIKGVPVMASFFYSVLQAFFAGAGFALALLLMSGIRERLDLVDIPEALKGIPIAFVIASLMSLAFMGFVGFQIK